MTIFLGTKEKDGSTVSISDGDRRKHAILIGKSGTGKTTLMTNSVSAAPVFRPSRKKCGRPGQLSLRVNIKRVRVNIKRFIRRRNSQKTPQNGHRILTTSRLFHLSFDLRISNVVDVPNFVVSALLPEEIFVK